LRKFLYQLPGGPPLYHLIWAWLGVLLYSFPSRRIFVIGVTGTKGKSTVVELIGHILKTAGRKTALISSLGIEIAGVRENKPLDNTMPGRFYLQRLLRRAVAAGCQYAVVEVTSEGVVMNRHRFIDWRAAVFLNLHPEHIEAHKGFEKYREAKLAFFRYANRPIRIRSSQGVNFINEDDENADFFVEAAGGGRVVFFRKSELASRLVGKFNKYNLGAAVAVAENLGVDEETIRKAVIDFPGVPGRMEFVQKKPFAVVVDYAHTPVSLEEVYQALRGSAGGRKLICVFGSCGGGRDQWKRPVLGKIAAQYCDKIILTNEDPFDEPPIAILDQIERGLLENQKSEIKNQNYWKIVDRKKAIEQAIGLARPGDAVVITGKGSEEYIRVAGGQKIAWGDQQTILDILRK